MTPSPVAPDVDGTLDMVFVFGPGDTMVTNTAEGIPDDIVEGDESITFAISPNSSYTVGAMNEITITIQDETSMSVRDKCHLRCPYPMLQL